MTITEQEIQAQNAINEFVQKPCVFLLPGIDGQKASGVGSGILISTKKHIVILTAEHIAKPARELEYRLGFYKCLDPLPNFVAGIITYPGDVDVGLLILKNELKEPLEKLAIKPEAIPMNDLNIMEEDSIILSGFPWELSFYNRRENLQCFSVITYWCILSQPVFDAKGRYQVEWDNAVHWRSEKDLKLPSPEGISGGPLWLFRKPDKNAIWSSSDIGKVVGIQSAWNRKDTALIEPNSKWAAWFHESIKKIDNSFL